MKQSKASLILLTALVVLMCLSLSVLVPSGAVTPEALRRYIENTPISFDDEGEDFEFVPEDDTPVELPDDDFIVVPEDQLPSVAPAAPDATPNAAPSDDAQSEPPSADDFIVDNSAKLPRGARLIASAGASDAVLTDGAKDAADADAAPATLPLDFSAGLPPVEGSFTENSYEDPTISVRMETGEWEGSTYHAAYVTIAHASQLRTGVVGSLGSGRTNKTSALAKKFNAVVAINGDFYMQTKSGYIVRQGEVFRKKTSKNMDLLLIDDAGDLHILKRGADEQKDGLTKLLQEKNIVNGFFFGPGMVIDGEVQETPKDYQFAPFKTNPRAAIGQTGPLSYVLVVVDGRLKVSPGITVPQFAALMKQLGCQQAYNLDGGNSAALYFHDSLYSNKSEKNERSVSDILYFASAYAE